MIDTTGIWYFDQWFQNNHIEGYINNDNLINSVLLYFKGMYKGEKLFRYKDCTENESLTTIMNNFEDTFLRLFMHDCRDKDGNKVVSYDEKNFSSVWRTVFAV